jgi:hypothetical protein
VRIVGNGFVAGAIPSDGWLWIISPLFPPLQQIFFHPLVYGTVFYFVQILFFTTFLAND